MLFGTSLKIRIENSRFKKEYSPVDICFFLIIKKNDIKSKRNVGKRKIYLDMKGMEFIFFTQSNKKPKDKQVSKTKKVNKATFLLSFKTVKQEK